MNKQAAMVVFLGGLLVTPFAMGQGMDNEEQGDDPSDAAYEQMDIRDRQLDLERKETEVAFEREVKKIELEKAKVSLERERQMVKPPMPPLSAHGRHMPPLHGLFMAVCGLVNVLLAIWVFGDLRKRNTGSGLWVVITLLSGFFGALVYAVARLGDGKQGA